jgi:hypothetical protein
MECLNGWDAMRLLYGGRSCRRCLLSKRSDTDRLLIGCNFGHQSRQASFVAKPHSDARVSAGKPSNRPHRFIDFPDENWLRSVNFGCARKNHAPVVPPIYNATVLKGSSPESSCGRLAGPAVRACGVPVSITKRSQFSLPNQGRRPHTNATTGMPAKDRVATSSVTLVSPVSPDRASVTIGVLSLWSHSLVRFSQPRALGRKVSDEFTVPLCREQHRELHRRGDDAQWWRDAGVDAIATARDLWAQARSFGRISATEKPSEPNWERCDDRCVPGEPFECRTLWLM